MADKLLKVDEAAEMVGYKISTVRAKILKREWPYVKFSRSVHIRESFILRLIEQSEIPARLQSSQ